MGLRRLLRDRQSAEGLGLTPGGFSLRLRRGDDAALSDQEPQFATDALIEAIESSAPGEPIDISDPVRAKLMTEALRNIRDRDPEKFGVGLAELLQRLEEEPENAQFMFEPPKKNEQPHSATVNVWEWLDRSHLLELEPKRYSRIRRTLEKLDKLLYELDES